MAEIILEPTVQSKVIPLSIRLNDTDTSLVSQLVTNRQFNTADTDAWFGFTLEGLAATTGTFDLTLINLQDKSVFNHTDKMFNTNPFYYRLDSGTDELTNEIRHAGKWVGQLVVTLPNGDSATRKFIFAIEGHILDGTVVQTILLEDYNALIASIESAKDELTQYNIDYASLIGTVTEQEATRLEAEELRVIADALRETKEGIRQATFEANEVIRDGVVDSAIEGEMISQAVATKLTEKEATYTPRLVSVEQQLADKVDKGDVAVSDINKNRGLLDETFISDTLKSQITGTTAIGSTPPDKSITPNKATFFETGKNIVDKSLATEGFYVNQTTGALAANALHKVTDYTLNKSGTVYTVNKSGRIAYYDEAKVFISGENKSAIIPPYQITTPANSKYHRFSLTPIADMDTLQIEEGAVATSYEDYYTKIPQTLLDLPEAPIYPIPNLINGGTPDLVTAPFVSPGEASTRIDASVFANSGTLKTITFRASVSGAILIKFFELSGTSLLYKAQIPITAIAGLNTYYAGVDFTTIEVGTNWVIGFYSDVNGPKLPFIATTGVPNAWSFAGDIVIDKANIFGFTSNYHIAISAVTEKTIAQTDADIVGVKTDVAKVVKPSQIVMSTKFSGTTLPSGFTNVGFTISNGATSPATGGWDKQLVYAKKTTLDRAVLRAVIKLNDTACDFAIGRKGSANVGSAICRIDCVTNKLTIYKIWDNNVSIPPVALVDKTMTMPFVSGREYLVELVRDTVQIITIRITDTITNAFEELTNDFAVTAQRPVGWDYPTIIAFGGSFKVVKMEYASIQPVKPRLAIYGDSFIEGETTLYMTGLLTNRYAHKIKTRLNSDCFICGRGGETSIGLLDKLTTDFACVSATYTLLAIGTNDTVFATWLTNITKLIAAVEAKGSIPILATLTKMTSYDRTAFMTEVNNWILASGYLYLDANLVTSLNNDRQTQDTSLFMVDGVHPNALGHDVIYKRFLVDVPEVFDGI